MELEFITNNLQKLIQLNGNHPEVWESVINTIKEYIPKIKKNLSINTIDAIKDLMTLMDEEWEKTIGQEVSCRKGCSHCCRIAVDISNEEADVLIAYCKDNNIQIDKDYLKSQALGTIENWHLLTKTDCVFLKDNHCSVYPVRPLVCRNYHVSSDPSICDPSLNDNRQPLVVTNTNVEILLSAIINCVSGVDRLPRVLLGKLE